MPACMPPQSSSPRFHAGFTLIELMVVVVVMAILAAVAAPSFVNVISNSRVRSQTSEFLTALASARSEAIKRGRTVCVRPVSGTDWASGYEVFTRETASSSCASRDSSKDTLIQTFAALSGGNTLTTSGLTVDADENGTPDDADTFIKWVRFNSFGVATDAAGRPRSISYNLCRQGATGSDANSRMITISVTGHVAVSSTAPTCAGGESSGSESAAS